MSGILSDAQIAGAAKSAGFTGSALAKIVAIALAESSGNPRAHNTKPPDNSYGLTQVNMYGKMGPARRKQFGLASNTDLFDPVTNMKAAYAISNSGKNFTPWSTYTFGHFLRYMSRANKAAGSPDSPPSGANNGGVQQAGLTDAFDGVSDFITLISDSKTWLRAGMIVGGAFLLAIAMFQMAGLGAQAKQIASVATDVLPQTRALKAVGKAVS